MLKSRNVFVDTQAFHQQKFRFDHPTLKRLFELCSSGAIQLVLTETVLGEVRAHIKQQLAEASKLLSQFQNNIGLFSFARRHGRLTTVQAEVQTQAKRATIKLHLAKLVKDGHLLQHGTGRGTWYTATS